MGNNGVNDIVDLLRDPVDPQILERLDEPLDPEDIRVRRAGGGEVPYIEGYLAITAANEIFGADNWGYTTTKPELVMLDGGPVWMALVTVWVRGCLPKTDLGIALPAIKRGGNVVTREAHRTAAMGAVTQGLKRALRTFGPAFGIDLYDSEYRDGVMAEIRPGHQRSSKRAPAQREAQASPGTHNGGSNGSELPPRPWDPATLKRVILWRANKVAESDRDWQSPPPDALLNIVSGAFREVFAEHESDATPFTPFECMDMVCEYLFEVDFANLNKALATTLRRWLVGDKPGKGGRWVVNGDAGKEALAIFAQTLADAKS